jgi:hypothetical protein
MRTLRNHPTQEEEGFAPLPPLDVVRVGDLPGLRRPARSQPGFDRWQEGRGNANQASHEEEGQGEEDPSPVDIFAVEHGHYPTTASRHTTTTPTPSTPRNKRASAARQVLRASSSPFWSCPSRWQRSA